MEPSDILDGPLTAPITSVTPDPPQPGIALCLSGGGSRAMLFHVGALLRLNELGLLARVGRFSSVSGGSITAGVLARRWDELAFTDGRATNLEPLVVKPLRELARHRIDVLTWVLGTILPGTTPARRFADVLDEHLYDGWRLNQLPDTPRFVINATNIGTGSLFRFSKPFQGDYLLGRIYDPDTRLALAVAASSAFPPFYSPLRLDLASATWVTDPGNLPADELAAMRRHPALGDGGMYDNLGLETAWNQFQTILVSDGGGTLSRDPHPPGGFLFQPVRVTQVIDRQVRALRKRLLVRSYIEHERSGAYWGIRTDIANYAAPGTLPCPPAAVARLAAVPTRLTRMAERTQERLINWGYAVTDAAIRAHVVLDAPAPAGFPYPKAGVGEATD
jgi:NTE family protein